MKQAEVTLPSGCYLMAEVPEESTNLIILDGALVDNWQDEEFIPIVKLPPGTWELLGANPTQLTEEEAGEIVEKVYQYQNVNSELMFKEPIGYMDYEEPSWRCETATASLDSLAAANGIKKSYVILKKK